MTTAIIPLGPRISFVTMPFDSRILPITAEMIINPSEPKNKKLKSFIFMRLMPTRF